MSQQLLGRDSEPAGERRSRRERSSSRTAPDTAGRPLRLEAGFAHQVTALPGPLLLRGVGADRESPLRRHRRLWREPDRMGIGRLVADLRRARVYGRGGAEFPFWRKVQVTEEAGKRREVVVNGAEGEPASAKDSTLLMAVPHLVLDGAQLVAEALGVRTVYVIVPADRQPVGDSVRAAVAERAHGRRPLRFEVRESTGGFVGGQSRAIVELLSGRPNLPVTTLAPEAVSGLRGRPTLMSNAETFAQVAALHEVGYEEYAGLGTADEPGTRLLSVAADGDSGVVVEVPHGTALADVLTGCGYGLDHPVLMGGFHGTWLSVDQVRSATVSPAGLLPFRSRLGAGVVLPLMAGDCPVVYTAQISIYLAQQRAQRCGPCVRGLPELAQACERLSATGRGARGGAAIVDRIRELCALVAGRGACQHPDGTARLVISMLDTFADEVSAHEHGVCSIDRPPVAGRHR